VTPTGPGPTAQNATPDTSVTAAPSAAPGGTGGAGETRDVRFFSVARAGGPIEGAKQVADVTPLDPGHEPAGLPFVATLLRAGERATGTAVVVLAVGVRTNPADFGAALELLTGGGHVGVVVPQVLGPDGFLAEAGAVTGVDGTLVSCGAGESPNRSEHSFRRLVDGTRFGCIALRRALLPMLALDPTGDDDASVVVATLLEQVRGAGHAVVYEPNWSVTLSRESTRLRDRPRRRPFERTASGRVARHRNTRTNPGRLF
jgi:hypothetical protein